MDFEIDVYNIGNGAAKEIELDWEFDKEWFMQEFKRINTIDELKVECSEKTKFRLLINLQNNGTIYSVDFTKKITHILPTIVKVEPTKISIPNAYLHLLSILLSVNDRENISLNVPLLELKLQFRDVGGNYYRRSFTIRFNICSLLLQKEAHEVTKVVTQEVKKRGADFAIVTDPQQQDKKVDLKEIARMPADTSVTLNQYNVFAYKKVIRGINVYLKFTGDVSRKITNDGKYIGVAGGYDFDNKKAKLGLRISF
jgi:hypothetical protein